MILSIFEYVSFIKLLKKVVVVVVVWWWWGGGWVGGGVGVGVGGVGGGWGWGGGGGGMGGTQMFSLESCLAQTLFNKAFDNTFMDGGTHPHLSGGHDGRTPIVSILVLQTDLESRGAFWRTPLLLFKILSLPWIWKKIYFQTENDIKI